MHSGLVAVNGFVSSPEKASISVFDRGFLFGDNIFEVFVAFNRQILSLDLHLERLRRSGERLGLPIPWSNEELKEELTAILAQLGAPKVYVRLMITRGQGLGLEISESLQANKIVMALPAKPFPSRHYEQGLSLTIANNRSTKRGAQAKTGNYSASIVAIQGANREGFDDVLWCNDADEFTEASTANIFFIARHGHELEVVTPHLDSGLLQGITRNFVIEVLRRSLALKVSEIAVYREELPRFDEAFICSTMRGVMPVHCIDQHRFHTRRPQSSYQHIEQSFLAAAWHELGGVYDWNSGKALGA